MSFCENCGTESTSLFCENCGKLLQHIPTSFSNDDSLAGMLVKIIQTEDKMITLSELTKLTKNLERSIRIFSQLEKTSNFFISVDQTEPFLTAHKTQGNPSTSLKMENKLTILMSLAEMFPLFFDEIKEFQDIYESLHEIKSALERNFNKNYQITNTMIKKKKI